MFQLYQSCAFAARIGNNFLASRRVLA